MNKCDRYTIVFLGNSKNFGTKIFKARNRWSESIIFRRWPNLSKIFYETRIPTYLEIINYLYVKEKNYLYNVWNISKHYKLCKFTRVSKIICGRNDPATWTFKSALVNKNKILQKSREKIQVINLNLGTKIWINFHFF